jgi:hypothetical protein
VLKGYVMADFQIDVNVNDSEVLEALDAKYRAGYNEGWEAGYDAGFLAADSYIQFEGEGI